MAPQNTQCCDGSEGGIKSGGHVDSSGNFPKYVRSERANIADHKCSIAPVTAHAAFDKGCQYLGMKYITVPVAADYRVDMNAVRRAITPNTILVLITGLRYLNITFS